MRISPLACAARLLCALWIPVAAGIAAPAANAGEQAERALAGVRSLFESGELRPGTALRLGFKQGNINAFLGRDLELQREWERLTGVTLDARIIPQWPTHDLLAQPSSIDLTVARNHEYPDLVAEALVEDLTPLFDEFGFRLDDAPPFGFIAPRMQSMHLGRIIAIPADGDVALLYLRSDLLDDPAEQAAFHEAYGRPLTIPQTWREYEDLLRFFHRPDQGLYGAAEERDQDGAWMFWLPRFLAQAAPAQRLFDEQMRPQIDTPAGIAATESYVAAVRYSPPGITDEGKDYNFTLPLFAQARAFATITTAAGARLFNAASSPVRGRFVVAALPGLRHNEVLVRRTTVIYGNNLVIPRAAVNARLAFLFAMWLTDPDVSTRSIGVLGGFADPYRWNHLQDPRIRDVYGPQVLEVFAAAWATALPPGTGLPGDREYLAALDRNLTAAARGETSPREAMARTAAEWESITDRRGRTAQRRHWLSLLDPQGGTP